MTDILKDDPHFLRTVLNSFPAFVFLMDHDVRILDHNDAAGEFMNQDESSILDQRCGDVFHCLNSYETANGCGWAEACKECILRNSVTQAIQEQKTIKHRLRLKLKTGDSIKNFHALINVTPFRYHDENMAILVMEDVSKLLELRQVLPICVKCKKIRNDSEYWDHLEKFFKEWLDLDFSHGLCPDCYEEELKKIKTFQPKIQLGIRLPSEKKE